MHASSASRDKSQDNHYDAVIVGGGQAGLATGYFLKRGNAHFVILDDNARTGDSWRKRWDSLRLFTPSQFNGLPGMRFPAADNTFPTKDEIAGYLEEYARRFELPVKHAVRVERVARENGGYRVHAGDTQLITRNVIVANGPYRLPRIPGFSSALDQSITQLHSSAYCNPAQVRGQKMLVVGAGNSGAEIALELRAAGKEVWVAGRDVGVLPITRRATAAFGGRPFWWISRHIINVGTPMGRKAKAKFVGGGHPLGRARREDLANAGVQLVGRVAGTEAGKPRLEDGRLLDADTIVWATGYLPDFNWIELPIFGEDGFPKHQRGVVPEAHGLFFVGLPFQAAITSSLVGGVGADAEYIARQVARRATAA